MTTYHFKEIEQKWQKLWEEKKCFSAPNPTIDKRPYYILVMFPYPSGHLHMGHVRNYTIGDILARYYRRRGRAVLHPIGWDAFGLPAENAAIERGIDPGQWTMDNIKHMRGQLKMLGISYDWDREFATCTPEYYRWNQWIFIKMFEKGLAFRKKSPVNWCPKCATVLANEQVHNGRCWRCHTDVIQKELEQWFFKISEFAEQLLEDHKHLAPGKDQKGWPEEVLIMQKNWIGKSWGAFVDFEALEGGSKRAGTIRVFTTRPDTLFGATFMVLSPEHPMVEKLTTPDKKKSIETYREKARKTSKIDRTNIDREKTGEFTGSFAINPVNGNRIPIWIADYVMMDYGTGAIMAVPAHDSRDFAFAQKFKIPVIQVIQNPDQPLSLPLKEAYEGDGVLINSGPYDHLSTDESKKKIADDLKAKGLGEPTVTYKLRDWLLSRQRYWGTPIPIVYCPKCGAVPVKLEDLPVKLPANVKFTGQGDSPLKQSTEWVKTTCPKCSGPASRETDTMDTFVDSSWYYARYTDPKNEKLPFEAAQANTWIPVHQYVGGIEHACMHLIYSRFFHKVLRDMGLVKSDEPFASLLTQGMVTLGGSAMSKSKGNVVDPKTVVDKYGSDTARMFILFAAPPTQQLEWSDQQVGGIWRFLNRVWRLGQMFSGDEDAKSVKRSIEESSNVVSKEELTRMIHATIERVGTDIERDFGFNTAISAIMELVNAIYLYPDLGDDLSKEAVSATVQLLEPFAPHMAEELWEMMGNKSMLSQTKWPQVDKDKLLQKEIQIIIQVNGKLRHRINVPSQAKEEEVKSLALAAMEKRGQKIVPKRVIFVPHKLVNFVEN